MGGWHWLLLKKKLTLLSVISLRIQPIHKSFSDSVQVKKTRNTSQCCVARDRGLRIFCANYRVYAMRYFFFARRNEKFEIFDKS